MNFRDNHDAIDKMYKKVRELRQIYYNYDESFSKEKADLIKAEIEKTLKEIEFFKNMRKVSENERIDKGNSKHI